MDISSLKKMLAQNIYSDGVLEQVILHDDKADVFFRDYVDTLWYFHFTGVVYIRTYEFGGNVEGVSARDASPEIEEAIASIEKGGGKREGYPGLVQVSFWVDSIPVLTVVFQDLHIQSA